jgi:HSP20 family protein
VFKRKVDELTTRNGTGRKREKQRRRAMAQEQETTSQEKEREQEAKSIQVSKPQETARVPQGVPRSALAPPEWSSPFGAMRRLMEDMDRLFSGFGMPSLFGPTVRPLEVTGPGFWVPAIESFERNGKLVLHTDLPGLRREDIHVEVVGNELVVSGERKEEERETRGGRHYSERRYGAFERRITLPAGLAPESIDASFDNGVLEISLPIPGRESRRIEIKSPSKTAEESEQAGAVH